MYHMIVGEGTLELRTLRQEGYEMNNFKSQSSTVRKKRAAQNRRCRAVQGTTMTE